MKSVNHHIDDAFRKKLVTLEITPPPNTWNNIENQLNKKHKAGLFLYFKIAIAAGIALFIGFSGLYFYNYSDTNKTIVSQHTNNNQQTSYPYRSIKTSRLSSTAKAENTTGAKSHFITDTQNNPQKRIIDTRKTPPQNIADKKDEINRKTINEDTNNEYARLYPVSSITCKSISMKPVVSHIVIPKDILNATCTENGQALNPQLIANSEIINRTRHWSIEGQYAPLYSYRSLSHVASNLPSKSAYNEAESGFIAYSFGLKANYNFNKHICFQFGIFYSLMGQTMKDIYMITSAQNALNTFDSHVETSLINSSLGPINSGNNETSNLPMINPSNNAYFNRVGFGETLALNSADSYTNVVFPLNATLIQQFKFLELPVNIRYVIGNRKLKVNLAGGFSVNFLLNSNALLKKDGEKNLIGTTTGLKTVNFAYTMGVGLSYPVRPWADIIFEPTFKYHLNNIRTDASINAHLYSFGIYTGINFHL